MGLKATTGGLLADASNAVLPSALTNLGLRVPLLSSRPPTIADDAAHAQPAGGLWRADNQNQVYVNQSNVANAAIWSPLNKLPLPGDAATITPVVAYAAQQIVKVYAGPLVRVQKADATFADVGFLSDGNFDYATFNAFAQDTSSAVGVGSISATTLTISSLTSGTYRVNQGIAGAGIANGTVITALGTGTGGAGTYTVNISQSVGGGPITASAAPVRVSKLYDQKGGGANGDAVQATFNAMPIITSAQKVGRNPEIVSQFGGGQFLVIPAAVALTKNSLAIAYVGRVMSAGDSSPNMVMIGKSGDADALQIINQPPIGANVSFVASSGSRSGYITPNVLTFSSPTSGSWTLNSGQYTALTGNAFGAVALTGGIIGDPNFAISGKSIATTKGSAFSALMLYSAPFAAADPASLSASIVQAMELAPQVQDIVVSDGESNTEATNTPDFYGYQRQVADALSGRVRMIDNAVGGQTVTTMLSRYPTYVAPYYNASRTNNIYFLWPGANDIWINARTAAQIMPDILSLVALAKATGFRVIVATEPDRTGTGTQVTEKDALSALIISNAATAGYTVAPISASAAIGTTGQSTNLAWFVDGAHFTKAGAAVAAGIAAPVIISVLH